jgi:hypothetical protein
MENSTNSVYENVMLVFGYFELIIGLVGVIGNILVIIVFSRQSLKNYTYSFYSRAMAISDICLMSFPIIDWVGSNLGANLITVTQIVCKIIEFMPPFFGLFSLNMLTLIAIDRMVTVVYPKRFIIMKNRLFQYIIIMIVILLVLLASILTPLSYTIVEIKQIHLTRFDSV